jgi:opacity protein-like surface antigen
VQAGFNYQTPYNLVVGVEGEFTWTDMSATETTISTAPRFVGFSSIALSCAGQSMALDLPTSCRLAWQASRPKAASNAGLALACSHTRIEGITRSVTLDVEPPQKT